jgi:predicted GTPase
MSTENYKNEKLPKIAIIGRPNVGSLHFINS